MSIKKRLIDIKAYHRDINLLNLQIVENIGKSLKGGELSCADILLALQKEI